MTQENNSIITIEKKYTKKEAFVRFIELYNKNYGISLDEYKKIVDFLGIQELLYSEEDYENARKQQYNLQ